MEKDYLVLKRASASRPSGEWSDDDYDVLAEGVIVGRIMKAAASPVETPWLWTLAPGITKTAPPPTDMRRRARLPWQRSRRAGGRNDTNVAGPHLHLAEFGFFECKAIKRQKATSQPE